MPEIKHTTFGSVGNSPEQQKKPMTNDDLKDLIELGCVKDKITIGNYTFELRTLNAAERLELSNFIGDEPDGRKLFEFNAKLLALSVVTVNGKLFEDFHGDLTLDPLTRKAQLLTAMQAPVLNELLEFYTNITERADGQFTPEQVKN